MASILGFSELLLKREFWENRGGFFWAPVVVSGIIALISIGSMLFAPDYWINDPAYYRLPPAYGPYRWVRYYDDVLLIDLRSGRVVDAIHDFFW
mgnify:CR=1 FL=1